MKSIEDYRTYADLENIQVTVFIATYNRSKSLKKAIESVLKQSYDAIALVILDNASTDETKRIVAEIKEHNIFYFCQDYNIGGIRNLNTAFRLAETPYFLIFHDDDVMREQLIEIELKEISNNEYACVSSRAILKDIAGNIVHSSQKGLKKTFKNEEYFTYVMKGGESVLFPTVMYRKSFMNMTNLRLDVNAGPCCDYYLLSEMCMHGGTLCILPDELLVRNIHVGMDSIKSAFWMNIQVLNYFCHNEKYIQVAKNIEDKIKNGYIQNALHLVANTYEGKFEKDKMISLLNDIPVSIFTTSVKTTFLKYIIKKANARTELFAKLVFMARKAMRKVKYRNKFYIKE